MKLMTAEKAREASRKHRNTKMERELPRWKEKFAAAIESAVASGNISAFVVFTGNSEVLCELEKWLADSGYSLVVNSNGIRVSWGP